MNKADIVKAELQAIYDTRGRLVADDIVDVAAAEDHPLHAYFEWDDSEASRLFRLAQAAGLVRSVKIKVTSERSGEVTDYKIRAWLPASVVNTEHDDDQGYVPEEAVRMDPARKNLMLQQMRRDWGTFKRRYEHLSEFWELVGDGTSEEATG